MMVAVTVAPAIIDHVKADLGWLAMALKPQEMLDLLEPYVEEAKGKLIKATVEAGNYQGCGRPGDVFTD